MYAFHNIIVTYKIHKTQESKQLSQEFTQLSIVSLLVFNLWAITEVKLLKRELLTE